MIHRRRVDESRFPLDTVRDAVVIEHADGTRDLAFGFVRVDDVSRSLIVPVTLAPRNRETRLLNRLRAHGILVRITT